MKPLKTVKNLKAGLLLGAALALGACSGDGRPLQEAVETNQLNLTAISINAPAGFVTDPVLSVSPGQKINFVISATNTSNPAVALSASDRRWSVDQPTFASIDGDGKFTAIANGMVDVKLKIGGLETSYIVNISEAALTAINTIQGAASLERCMPASYSATGTYSDGTTRGLFGADWSVADSETGFAGAQDEEGKVLVTAINAGLLNLVATVGSIESQPLSITVEDTLQDINITPVNVEISEESTLNLTARGSYSRGDTVVRPIITNNVSWSITPNANAGVATVSDNRLSKGLVTGVNVGNTSVTVSCGNETQLQPVTVLESESTDTAVLAFEGGASQTVSLLEDISLQLRVSTGDEYDTANPVDSDEVEWSLVSESPVGAVTLDANGLVTLNATGSATIRVMVGEDTADLVLTIAE